MEPVFVLESDRVIAYRPELAKFLGSIPAAILYQQLYFWSGKGKRDDGFIYKSRAEIEDETYLTRHQQELVVKKLRAIGWIETKKIRVNGAPTLHYRCLKSLQTLVVDNSHSDLRKNGNQKREKTEIRNAEKRKSLTRDDALEDTRKENAFKKKKIETTKRKERQKLLEEQINELQRKKRLE